MAPLLSANLAVLLQGQAITRPDHPALLDPIQPPITFAALQRAVEQEAARLHKAGLRAGDHVLVYQPISAELYVALGALFYAGLTVVFIDPGMRGDQLERAANVLKPRGFIATPRAHLLRLISPAIRRIPIRFTTGSWPLPGARRWCVSDKPNGMLSAAEHPSAAWAFPERFFAALRMTASLSNSNSLSASAMAHCDDDTPALITVTSGSTGTPKFATRTHGFLRRQHEAIDASLAMAEDTVVATTLPIFALSFLASGVTILLPTVDLRRPGAVKVAPLLAQMQRAGVNALAASPALLDQIARFCDEQQTVLPHIRQVYSGGAPVFVDLMDEVAATMPNATFHAVYGATEAEPVATLDSGTISIADRQRMARGAGLLVGKPVASVAVRVIPARWGEPHGPYSAQEWAELALSSASGEIVVAGPHVLTTVGPGEDATLTKIGVGEKIWHRTGDAGRWDEDGRLWLLGRCAARIDRTQADGSTQTLYPLSVESAAHTFPAIKHAALVEQAGRCVLALELYAPQGARWLDDLRAALAWAALDEIRVLARMPVDKRHNAKIDYPALRRLLDLR